MAVYQLIPTCKDYIWGGNKLRTIFHKESDSDRIAESWELSCHPDGPSYLMEKGKKVTLAEAVKNTKADAMGKNCQKFEEFPVLIKLIDACDNLSIQVHPSDEYALKNEHQYGKTEMWYIVDCEENAGLYFGFKKEISKEEFAERIQEDRLLEVLNWVPVKKGDTFFIEAGTIHAIGKGIVIAEIQQNSNVTYRVYDYGRIGKDGKKRDLHIDKAIAVTNRTPKDLQESYAPHLGICKYFCVDKLNLDGIYTKSMSGTVLEDSFLHILILEGNGTVTTKDNSVSFRKGDSLFLPASSGAYEIEGTCEAILTTIPDME